MELLDWREIDTLTLVEAAYLLGGIDPGPYRQGAMFAIPVPEHWIRVLMRSVKTKVLRAHIVVIRGMGENTEAIPPEAISMHDVIVPGKTEITADHFVDWCKGMHAPIPWQFLERANRQQPCPDLQYPAKLRAAIHAFNALHGDPAKLHGKSPKQAIKAWLEENTDLGPTARDDVAKVANWEPGGGPGTHHHE
ncbi:MAG TPA: hypothetical protein VF269_07800 [Rhodanobacteraceae bacterium]